MIGNDIPPGAEVHRDLFTGNVVVTLGDRGFVVTREEMEDGLGEQMMNERFRLLTGPKT